MQLDDRSNKLLEDIISIPGIKGKDLETKYSLSRRQLGYSFDKINNWLSSNNLPEIIRTKQGHFVVDQSVITKLISTPEKTDFEMSILSEEQRIYLIILMILSNKELSLIHFTSELDVSKNTVLHDLKRVQACVEEYGLNVRYSRRDGYLIEGKEFEIRKLLIKVIYRVLEMPNGEERLNRLATIEKDDVDELIRRIEKVENKLNLKFTDEKIETMPFILTLTLRRIKQGNTIKPFYIHYEELSDTKEYLATEELLYDFETVPMEERLFITLHLLTTNVYWSEFLTQEAIPNLIQAIDNMLRQFEKTACIYLQDRDQLLNKLLLHIKPAYYRIKYQLTEVNESPNTVSDEFKELHHLVRKSTGPLETLIGSQIPETETTYITMLIGGWLTRQGDSIQEKVKAIVVCPRGVSVSRLMYSELRELFPEFVFLDSLSVREFQSYDFDYDIVFSPVFIQTDKKLFITSTFLEREEKFRLRKQVMLELHGYAPSEISIAEVMDIIKKHAVIEDEHNLSKELHAYLKSDNETEIASANDRLVLNLDELITPSRITLAKSAASWEEAIRLSAGPLLESGHIEPQYVEAIVTYDKDPYIVIGPNIAIPHASPDDGVNKVAMSLLRLEEGVEFTADYSINLVIVIAAVDKQQHLRALMQLLKLAGNEDDRNAIIHAENGEEVFSIIKKYSQE
ncbi:BglG family transcription antiterminator [Virgibacillus kekensis]|uniref:Ascorbate-specific PTS system EIIA component n=1 Tax=Virgibacillus kekensis TaxID=202261 RepID=A0ABV9DIG5_9BACI